MKPTRFQKLSSELIQVKTELQILKNREREIKNEIEDYVDLNPVST